MGILGILFLILILISFGVFIYMMVKTARGWGGLHTTMLFFIFFSTLVFLFAAGGVAKRRVGWVRIHDKSKKLNDDLKAEELKLKYGDLWSTTVDTTALVHALGQLTRLSMDRGRVWKNAVLFDVQQEAYKVRLPAAGQGGAVAGQPPGAPAAAAPVAAAAANPEGLLPVGLVVYAFAEVRDPEGRFLPKAYLGEFLVEKSAGNEAELKPTSPLLPSQRAFIAQGNAAQWSIYELMPLDSHEVFAAEGSTPSEAEAFGRMDPQQISQYLGIAPNEANPALAALLQSYIKDGSEAPDDIKPENLWILVEFIKEHAIDVDSKEKRNATEGGFYDQIGRTVDERLKRGEETAEVKFQPGDKRLLWKGAAEELINQGFAKAIKRVYVRTLNNYSSGFRDVRQSYLVTLQKLELLKRENEIVKQTNQRGQEQIAFRQDERQKLEKDLAQLLKEQAVAKEEASRLENEMNEFKTKIASTFQQIRSLHAKLVSAKGGN